MKVIIVHVQRDQLGVACSPAQGGGKQSIDVDLVVIVVSNVLSTMCWSERGDRVMTEVLAMS